LLDNLRAAGVAPDSIDAVVLSHTHFDHAGGCLSAYGDGELRLVFPKARYLVGRRHFERAQSPHARDRASFVPELNRLLVESGRLELVEDGGANSLAPLVRMHFSDGHTPGLMLSEIRTPAGPLLFAADLIPGLPWVHVPITMGYDRYPELLIDEKERLLADLVARGGLVYFTHDPTHPCARIARDAKGKYSGVVTDVETLARV
jgi:glyoxylase-like metal-dependent hydrolase (beta-lactamase superfamily II)